MEIEKQTESQVDRLNKLLEDNSTEVTYYDTIDPDGEVRVVGHRMTTYTPEMAKYILENFNKTNRPIKQGNVDHITNEMNRGNWMFNGEVSCYDENGNLINSQHRFCGIVKSGRVTIIPTWTNLHPDSYKTMDSGQTRTSADILSIDNVENPGKSSGVTKFVNEVVHNSFNNSNKGRKHTLSNTDVLNYYNVLGSDKIQESIEFYENTKPKGASPLGLPAKVVSGFHYVLTTIDSENGQKFMEKLMTGTGITEGCPIKLLRDKLTTSKISTSNSKKLNYQDKINYIIYTWTKFINRGDTNVKLLRLPKNWTIELDFNSIPKR